MSTITSKSDPRTHRINLTSSYGGRCRCIPLSVPLRLLKETLHCAIRVSRPFSANSRSSHARAKKPRASSISSRSMMTASCSLCSREAHTDQVPLCRVGVGRSSVTPSLFQPAQIGVNSRASRVLRIPTDGSLSSQDFTRSVRTTCATWIRISTAVRSAPGCPTSWRSCSRSAGASRATGSARRSVGSGSGSLSTCTRSRREHTSSIGRFRRNGTSARPTSTIRAGGASWTSAITTSTS